MSLFYQLAYRVGFTPWEKAARHPAAASQIHAWFNQEMKDMPQPLGRALDIGCGSGHWSVELAGRGWEVVGVDLVATAVHRARRLAAQKSANVKVIQGDVTRLREVGVGTDFALVWDFGTIHGLSPELRNAAGREIDAITTPNAVILLMAWTPGQRAPLPRGMSRDDLLTMLPGWRITREEPFDASGLPKPVRNVGPRMYRLERAQA
jgi:SAM-dependent methyltransferase